MRKFSPSLSLSLCLPSLTHFEMNYVVPSCAPSSVLFPCLIGRFLFLFLICRPDFDFVFHRQQRQQQPQYFYFLSLSCRRRVINYQNCCGSLEHTHTHTLTYCRCVLPVASFDFPLSLSNGTAVNVTNAGLDKH